MRLSEMVAWIEGRGVPSLIVARSLRQVGLIRTGGRGTSAANMTAADAGALLAGLAVSSVGACASVEAGRYLMTQGQLALEHAIRALEDRTNFSYSTGCAGITRTFLCSRAFITDLNDALGLEPITRPEPARQLWEGAPILDPDQPRAAQVDGAITVPEFCRRAGISTRTFYLLANRGEAPKTVRVGRARRILESTSNDWLKAREV